MLFLNFMPISKENLIISFNGDEGSGKSTIAQLIAAKLKLPRFYMGQIFRAEAEKSGLPLLDFLKLLEDDLPRERELDSRILKIAEEEKSFVIEGRVAWLFLPNSLKIYLKVSPEEAARRIYSGTTERNEAKNFNSIEDIKKSILERKERDSRRYTNLYGTDTRDEKNYDLVLDTTKLSIDEVCQKIFTFINEKSN